MTETYREPLSDSALRATRQMTCALEDGRWDPHPERDPAQLIEAITEACNASPAYVDLSQAHDLCAIALAAMSMNEWRDVSDADIAAMQSFNFLTTLVGDMVPCEAAIALAP